MKALGAPTFYRPAGHIVNHIRRRLEGCPRTLLPPRSVHSCASNARCLWQSRCAPENCKSFTIRGSSRILIHLSSSVITGKGEAVVWRPMVRPMEALVRMLSPSPAVDEDKVSQGREKGNRTSPGDPIVRTGKPS